MATSPAFPTRHPTDRSIRSRPSAMALAALFGVATYMLIAGRAVLNPDHIYPLWSFARLVSVAFGAGLFWIALRLVERWEGRPATQLALRAAALVVPASIAMLGARLLIDFVDIGDMRPAVNIRWVLVWMGYFTASLTAAVALQLHFRIEQLARALPEPSDEPASGDNDNAPADTSLWVQRQGASVRVPLEAIEWVEAEGNYVRIHAGEISGLIRMPLSAMEAKLGSDDFIRAHRSVLCRTSAIRAVKRRPSGAMLAELGSGAMIPVGRSYGARLRAVQNMAIRA